MIQSPTCAMAARAALLNPVLLLVAGLITWPPGWHGVRAVLDCARTPEPAPAERPSDAIGYYIELIEGSGGSGPRGAGRPADWVGFKDSGAIRYLDRDFLLFELEPGFRRVLCGQPFETNAHGMHDYPVEIEKPEGTFRIAVLGASMDMGWGVRYQETYVNRLQHWLNAEAAAQAGPTAKSGAAGRPLRYEVLNFAVAAYSPLQRLETLRRKVLAFRPDLVIYSATTLDERLMEIHLCDMLERRVDVKYDFVREAIRRAGVVADDLRIGRDEKLAHKDRLKRKLAPTYWGLYDRTLGALAAECRSAGVALAMVIIPRVGSADAPDIRAEPVARLKALAAHHAVTAFDLSDAFDRDDAATLEIAARDGHPNAMGHRRLFEALARAIDADPALAPLVHPGPALPGATRGDELAGDAGPSS